MGLLSTLAFCAFAGIGIVAFALPRSEPCSMWVQATDWPEIKCFGQCDTAGGGATNCVLEQSWIGPPFSMYQFECWCPEGSNGGPGACAGVAQYFPGTGLWDYYCENIACAKSCACRLSQTELIEICPCE